VRPDKLGRSIPSRLRIKLRHYDVMPRLNAGGDTRTAGSSGLSFAWRWFDCFAVPRRV